ncbi:MAG: phosphoesterase [Solirubrobacterales bacterium]|nr:phosphoesterase [Solirubrobacterales bacterium]
MRSGWSRWGIRAVVAGVALLLVGTVPVALAARRHLQGHKSSGSRLDRIKHVVVIYEENHSFDDLYGGWEGVNGLAAADAAHKAQVTQSGTPYQCLLQNDVNLTSPSPLPTTCTDTTTSSAFPSAFRNAPFAIDDYIGASDTTCPPPGVFAAHGVLKGTGQPGGCTEDLVHRFYQEQYQLDAGKQDRYVTGSDAVGLSMGNYHTRTLPIYKYLHEPGHPHYAIADDFFQGAFGGSFLNHQWLIAAATPTFADPPAALRSQVDSNGMPNNYPLYTATGPVADKSVTATCAQVAAVGKPALGCGDYAVNTTQPPYQPYAPGTPAANLLPPQTSPTIGDRLSAAGVGWAWYSGGWSNADGDVGAPGWTNGSGPVTVGTNTHACPDSNALATATWPNCADKLFQFHHQAFNYFANYAPGTPARARHLRDETEFMSLADSSKKSCNLKPVSFVKPIGAENEHPGYTGETQGSDHLVKLLKSLHDSPCSKDTMVVVTYDEFGGQWDHVSPPGQGGTPGPHDRWGPGTRVPALVVSPGLRGDFVVDHAQHDTTSILSTIEERFRLQPLGSRDAQVASLSSVFAAREPNDGRHESGLVSPG